jgi:hypothetical protein
MSCAPYLCSAGKIFNYEWEPVSTSVEGVGVEVNILNVAPCALVVDAAGVKVWAPLLPVNVRLLLLNMSHSEFRRLSTLLQNMLSLVMVAPSECNDIFKISSTPCDMSKLNGNAAS